MCKVLQVHPSGFYAWRDSPLSERAVDDRRVLGLIKQSWLENGTVYGYRKIAIDLRDLGASCGKHRVARLMRLEGLKSQAGYGRRPDLPPSAGTAMPMTCLRYSTRSSLP